MIDDRYRWERKIHLEQMFGDRRRPRATRLSYALASREDQIIRDAESSIASEMPDAKVVALMFDGFVVWVPRDTGGRLLWKQ